MMDSESILLIGMVVGLFGSLMMLAGDLLQHLSTEKLESIPHRRRTVSSCANYLKVTMISLTLTSAVLFAQ